MPMQADPDRPGLWTNTDWNGGPGTFAVVIGVSRYHHLIGGDEEQTREPYGLEQLKVSALTAYRFFDWLSNRYRNAVAPLAKCWLLLSPTPDELAYEPALPADTPRATLANCRDAIHEWFAAMETLPPAYQEESRALFFFSGHGLEIATDRQILLPCDYLRPPMPVLNDAISTYNLYGGLRKLGVREQIFLLDACRNDHTDLRQNDLKGNDILNIYPAYMANPDVIAPLIYATASGRQAWAPDAPRDGITLFGQALLEGLRAEEGCEPDCAGNICNIMLYQLHQFLDRRVNVLHEQRGSRVRQPVRLSGAIAQIPLTQLPPRPTRRRTRSGRPTPAAVAVPFDQPAADFENRTPQGAVPPQVLHDFAQLHLVFDSEVVTEMWQHALVMPLLPFGAAAAPSPFTLQRVERGIDGLSFRVVLTIDAPGTHWLRLNIGNEYYGCVLPDDIYDRPRYEIEFSKEHGTGLMRIETGIAEDTGNWLLQRAARLWKRYRSTEVGDVIETDDMRELVDIVRHKMESALAATIAAVILLRARRHNLPLDWLANLAGVGRPGMAPVFAPRPDGAVLYAEYLLREIGRNAQGVVHPAGRAVPLRTMDRDRGDMVIRMLIDLERRGLPHTADALGYASRQVNELLECGLGSGGARPEDEERVALQKLDERLDHAVAMLRAGGLFAAFVGSSELITPSLVAPAAPIAAPAADSQSVHA